MPEKWEHGRSREIRFWKGWISKFGNDYADKTKPLPSYLKPMINGKVDLILLDVGSGALNLLGFTWNNLNVSVRCCDILAHEYKEMWEELGIEPNAHVEYQDMAYLSYPDNSFDIVHCVNALDHCSDPRSAIKEMVRVCKVGGWVYLNHIKNQGRIAHYGGLHLWNIFSMDNRDCLIWNREDAFFISWLVKGFSTERKIEPAGVGRRVVSTLQKTRKH